VVLKKPCGDAEDKKLLLL
jgi:putative transposase